MKKLAALAVVLVASIAFAGAARATDAAKAEETKKEHKADPKAKAVAPVKAGDAVYVCGCGPECKCGSVSDKAGKCKCGKDLVKASVTKVEGDQISVKLASGAEQVFKAPYKCGCDGCNCTPAAITAGNCKCGKPLVKNE